MKSVTHRLTAILTLLLVGCYSTDQIDSTSSVTTESSSSSSSYTNDDYQANLATDEYMLKYYLYNQEYATTTRDYSLDYDDMLYETLMSMSTNVLDKKLYLYDESYYTIFSYITRSETLSSSRASSSYRTSTEFGFVNLSYVTMDSSNSLGLCINAVYDDSPASRAGISRGYIISHINGYSINILYSLGSTLPTTLAYPTDGQEVTLKFYNSNEEITLTAEQMEANPVVNSEILVDNVGYLNLVRFDYYFYDEILAALASLKEQGCQELIVDLRVNPGGHIIASNMLAASICTPASDEVFCYYRTNDDLIEDRTLATNGYGLEFDTQEQLYYDYYLSGLDNKYLLDLDHIYCLVSYSTASASELFINVLRSAGVEVTLVGDNTRGKNVGSYIYTYYDSQYEYSLSPIMFEILNNNFESDYSSGFEVDEYVDDYTYFCDFGTSEPMISKALELMGYRSRSGVEVDATQLTPIGEQLRNRQYTEGAVLGVE